MQYNTIRYDTMKYDAIQYNTTQYKTRQDKTRQDNAIDLICTIKPLRSWTSSAPRGTASGRSPPTS